MIFFPEGTIHEDVFTVLGDRLFVWDKPKNEANKQIHGIDFYTAIYVVSASKPKNTAFAGHIT